MGLASVVVSKGIRGRTFDWLMTGPGDTTADELSSVIASPAFPFFFKTPLVTEKKIMLVGS
jgi:hypothetical protein